MRIDLYTKAVLTVIALLLAVIAARPLIEPNVAVQAQPVFGNVQFMGGSDLLAMDKQTGRVWIYVVGQSGADMHYLGQFVGLGMGLVK